MTKISILSLALFIVSFAYSAQSPDDIIYTQQPAQKPVQKPNTTPAKVNPALQNDYLVYVQEPMYPQQPAQSAQDISNAVKAARIDEELKQLFAHITKTYTKQVNIFTSSGNKTVSPIDNFSYYRKQAKDIADKVIAVAKKIRHVTFTEYAEKLRPLVIKLFNAAETINNNLTDAVLDTDMGKQARVLVEESFDKLEGIGRELGDITYQCDKYVIAKNEFTPLAAIISTCAQAMKNIADDIRVAGQRILQAKKNTPAPAPKKSKNVFKRLFGG